MNIFDAVGNTPLFKLQHVYRPERGVSVYGKGEFLNPSGSVKDRAAKAMLLDGWNSGRLKPGMEILDATSGSTGIAYAMMAAQLGCSVTLCMPANVSRERKQIVHAYGGRIIETSPLEGSEGALQIAARMAAEEPGRYFYPDQYNNEQNWRAHYETTAEEIWEQTGGAVTHFVAGTGTAGTFVGTLRRLKELNPNICGVLMQPDSPFHGLEGLRHIGTAQYTGFFDGSLADEELAVDTEAAYAMTRRLAREEGLLVGISAAANVLAAIETAKNAPDGSVIVTVLCDSGIRYLDEPVWTMEG
ncbi:MAG: cysteine synthase family protein [Selenomonadaceae bacterium]|nr:cysteine synthase family protein [Selenomonadaceae bacterium]MBQ1915123.1 cysteine synthase family protein [Selenomonadaceae bacterium]MBQ7649706.1 cysteine synthase family protein [Victivallales bacterium]